MGSESGVRGALIFAARVLEIQENVFKNKITRRRFLEIGGLAAASSVNLSSNRKLWGFLDL